MSPRFVSDNGAGAAALVAVGALAGAFAAIGRWPTRVVFSGQELSWADVRETVESQIQTAKEGERPAAALAELAVLRERLDRLALTGEVPRHPAAEYDDQVADALRRVAPPGSRLLRTEVRSRETVDFELVSDDHRVYVETKWRRDPLPAFRGETLHRLLPGLPPGGAALLVVTTRSMSTPSAPSCCRCSTAGRASCHGSSPPTTTPSGTRLRPFCPPEPERILPGDPDMGA